MIPVLCTHVKALSLPRLEDALLADDWALPGCLVWDYWRSHKVRDFTAEPWHWATPPDPSKSRTVSGTRKVSMVMPVPPQPMCPPETRVTVSYDVGLAHDEHGKDILHVKSPRCLMMCLTVTISAWRKKSKCFEKVMAFSSPNRGLQIS